MGDVGRRRGVASRGQVGIGTLIVFIAMVLVAAIAAGVLVNTAGVLQSTSEQTGEASSDQATNGLRVLDATGLKTYTDGSDEVGAVELLVAKSPGSDPVALDGVTMLWIDDTGSYRLVIEDVFTGDDADGAFAHIPVRDADGSLYHEGVPPVENPQSRAAADSSPVINDVDDRVRIVVDIGGPDYAVDSTTDTYPSSTRVARAYDDLTTGYGLSVPELTGEDDGGVVGERDDTLPELSTEPYDDKIIRYDGDNVDPSDREGGLGKGESATIRLTTTSGATTTVTVTVPASVEGTSAVQL